jgi:hydrogenase expression/formation protein HypC
MCLAVPAQVVSIEGKDVKVNISGNTMRASLDLLDNVKVGDFVLLHAGYAIQKIDEEEAQKTLEIFNQLGFNDLKSNHL